MQHFELQLPVIDSNKYLARIANKAKVSEKTYMAALDTLSIIKGDPDLAWKGPKRACCSSAACCLPAGRRKCEPRPKLQSQVTSVS